VTTKIHRRRLLAPANLLLSGLLALGAGPLAAPTMVAGSAARAVAPAAAPDQPSLVYAWGDNRYGELNHPGGAVAVAIAAGDGFSLALKPDGTVVAWGDNADGECTIPAGATGITAIAAGGSHALALRSDGRVVAWGSNSSGESTVPLAALTGVVAISAGPDFSLALTSNHTVVAWGNNNQNRATPPAGLSGVTAISAGAGFSLALKSDGSVVAWGNNHDGQTNVPAGLGSVTAVSAGGAHSLALKSDGTVVAWGYESGSGELNVPIGLSGVTAVSAGYYFSLALTSNGTVAAWGWNNMGQINPPSGMSGVTAIDAGGWHSLALVTPPTVTATKLVASGLPTPRTAGTSGSIRVTAADSSGTTATGYTGTIHFASTDPAAILPADYTFTAADAGTRTFSVMLGTAGTQSVTATDTVTPSITGSQGGIVVVVRRPDGRIRVGKSGAFIGDNVYNTTGAAQSRTGSARKGRTITFGISIQNDGSAADSFKVKATGSASSRYTVKYFCGKKDITTRVVAGRYRTASLAAGATVLITAKVTVRPTASKGSRVTRLVTITSVGSSTAKDAVKFVARRA
jgi:hypothetical protein